MLLPVSVIKKIQFGSCSAFPIRFGSRGAKPMRIRMRNIGCDSETLFLYLHLDHPWIASVPVHLPPCATAKYRSSWRGTVQYTWYGTVHVQLRTRFHDKKQKNHFSQKKAKLATVPFLFSDYGTTKNVLRWQIFVENLKKIYISWLWHSKTLIDQISFKKLSFDLDSSAGFKSNSMFLLNLFIDLSCLNCDMKDQSFHCFFRSTLSKKFLILICYLSVRIWSRKSRQMWKKTPWNVFVLTVAVNI